MTRAAVIGGTDCICDGLTLTPLWAEYDILIINHITPDLLASTALGFETEITKALFKSKKVFMTKTAIAHIKKFSKPLISLYNPYFTAIIKLGVKVINCTDDIFKTKTNKKLLSAADLSEFSGTIFKVNKDTIITPLALDIARENNIKITKDDKL